MKKQILTSFILAGTLLLCGCADKSSSGSSTSSADSLSDTENAAMTYDYVHGDDGYYNLAEDLKYFKMPTQYSGTCWLYAASASMSTAYEKKTGKELDINIPEILESIFGNGKHEGFFTADGVDKADLGGYQNFITDRLSRECRDGITLDSSMIIDPNDRETIKGAIKARGGVVVVIDDWSSKAGVFGSYLTTNYDQAKKYDHDVTLIGWDDHFPKEYFEVPAAEDGAWIAYNSNINERYYYISYCSPFEQATSHTVSDEYSEVLSYDAGNGLDNYIQTEGSTKVANVFHKKGKLAAVGTFNNFGTQNIKIEIMSADFKDLLYKQDAVLDYNGYHTITLASTVDAEDFAVVITYEKGAPVEGESFYTGLVSYKTSIEKGQSFVFVDGSWKDMSDSDIKSVLKTGNGQSVCFSEKGEWRDYLSDSDMENLLKTDFEPGNCCIKALFME